MKSAKVPAQITTVEDKIAGNLSLQQLLLLAAPVFVNFILYILLPRNLHFNLYKIALMMLITSCCFLLAVRLKGKILLEWAITFSRYNLRPRFYVFNKNDEHLRYEEIQDSGKTASIKVDNKAAKDNHKAVQLSLEEIIKLEFMLTNPATNLSFYSHRKGGLYAAVTEIE